jgi:DNA-binding transcriptional MerR regulator
MSPACVCLQEKAVTLFATAWDKALATGNQSNIADLLHLAVNVQDPSDAIAMLQFVQHLRQKLVSTQQLQKQLQELQQAAATTRGRRSNVHKQQQKHAQLVAQLLLRLQEFDRQIIAAEIEQLLATAVTRMHPAVVEQLSMLPAAKQMPGAAIKRTIQLFIEHKSPASGVVHALLRLAMSADAAAALTATFATPALRTATPGELGFGGVRKVDFTRQEMMSGQQTERKKQQCTLQNRWGRLS